MQKVKLISISNRSALIAVDNNAYIVDIDILPTKRVGAEFNFVIGMLDRATPYGIDMTVIYPDGILIDPIKLQEKLFELGIFSLDDLKKKPSAINQALISIINSLSAEIYLTIKKTMEDYNDSV
jgi:hypothetical protein